MPEGDTIFRAARTLHRALAGRTVTHFESVYPALTRVDAGAPIAGRTVEQVTARGKHLLMTFSGDLTLHTHMRMNGAWHIYRPGERWRAPQRDLRVRFDTDAFVVVGFNIPVAEFLSAAELTRHPQLSTLGPDLAAPDFDREEVWRRWSAHAHDTAQEVLLNQRVLSGIGNEFKSEVLFIAGVYPFTPAGAVSRAAFDRLIDTSLRVMRMNTIESASRPQTFGRHTTGSLDPAAGLFVYGRGGRTCRRCGSRIESSKAGRDARLTYWCPTCQPAEGAK
ncbi:MAG: DNA-formamidopyrimidine glycosylase family protein [Vicinamibacterales bacterium]